MKTTRIGGIVAVADSKAAAILDAMPDTKAKSNAEIINTICKLLVYRKTPILPTAPIVAEEGRINNPHFPSEQTIYNRYAKILRVWKMAYSDVMNIGIDPPLNSSEIPNIDTSTMDVGTANIVDRLKEITFELTQRNNILKQIIDNRVPQPEGDIPFSQELDDVVLGFGKWLRSLADNPAFHLDDMGLKVSRKTPINTRIIDAASLKKFLAFTDDFQDMIKARKAAGA
ncbi:hypothetical protein C8J31_104330 [Rhizobium sp. PP-CC-2G-626]|nr:hypothetical protein C8J31_104330 [Rhizobium sp. PP-CC-2G-626]